MSEFCLPIRVYYEDTDAAGIVYHANYLKYMERARTEWLRALGFEQDRLARLHGIAFVVCDATLKFIRPAKFDDQLESICRLTRCGRASVEFEQLLVGLDKTVVCRGLIRVGCVDFRAMVPKAMPKNVYLGIKHAR
ncbi:MAG: tol-pal system-associated acyl-CoA thioesterase [Gammaproteobacteria bacterium]|nr:tol-pal system-associated acyl-CoA thioesterase [Gammaproteobacteria bacterium]